MSKNYISNVSLYGYGTTLEGTVQFRLGDTVVTVKHDEQFSAAVVHAAQELFERHNMMLASAVKKASFVAAISYEDKAKAVDLNNDEVMY